MSNVPLFLALGLLCGVGGTAKANPLFTCHKDADCRFAYEAPCDCPPCGEAPRPVETRAFYHQRESNWARKVPHCQGCKTCDPPTRWQGTRAVCRQGKCVVTGKNPPPLKRWQQANIGGVVYAIPVSWQDGQLKPLARALRSGQVLFEWYGLPQGFSAKEGARFTLQVILMARLQKQEPSSKKMLPLLQGKVVGIQPLAK